MHHSKSCIPLQSLVLATEGCQNLRLSWDRTFFMVHFLYTTPNYCVSISISEHTYEAYYNDIHSETGYHHTVFPGPSFHYLNRPNVYPTEPMRSPMSLPPFQHAFVPTFTGKKCYFSVCRAN